MFKRPLDFVTQRLLNLQYSHLVNVKNIESISRIKLWWFFRDEDFNIKQVYLHNIIDQWIKTQNQLSIVFFNKLKRLIRKYKLQLNTLEKHNLNLLEERVFSTMRHLKVLNVNVSLYEKETAYVRFDNSEIYGLKNNKLNLITAGELLMTNKRFIIINRKQNVISLPYRFLYNYKFTNYGLQCTNQTYKTIVLRIHDQITLNATFFNLVQKRIKWLSKKIVTYPPNNK